MQNAAFKDAEVTVISVKRSQCAACAGHQHGVMRAVLRARQRKLCFSQCRTTKGANAAVGPVLRDDPVEHGRAVALHALPWNLPGRGQAGCKWIGFITTQIDREDCKSGAAEFDAGAQGFAVAMSVVGQHHDNGRQLASIAMPGQIQAGL